MFLKELCVGDVVLENNLFLGPMAGVTDLAFRKVCRECSDVGLVECEMVSSRAIVYGDEKTQKEAMEAIEHAKGFIRYETVQEINLRVAPEFSFKLDNTLNNALRMEALIEKTIKEDEARRLAREEREGKSEDSPAEE